METPSFNPQHLHLKVLKTEGDSPEILENCDSFDYTVRSKITKFSDSISESEPLVYLDQCWLRDLRHSDFSSTCHLRPYSWRCREWNVGPSLLSHWLVDSSKAQHSLPCLFFLRDDAWRWLWKRIGALDSPWAPWKGHVWLWYSVSLFPALVPKRDETHFCPGKSTPERCV